MPNEGGSKVKQIEAETTSTDRGHRTECGGVIPGTQVKSGKMAPDSRLQQKPRVPLAYRAGTARPRGSGGIVGNFGIVVTSRDLGRKFSHVIACEAERDTMSALDIEPLHFFPQLRSLNLPGIPSSFSGASPSVNSRSLPYHSFTVSVLTFVSLIKSVNSASDHC